MTLINQIIDGLNEEISQRNDEFNNTIVKEIYKPLPKGTYPKIVVQEIVNNEVLSRSTSEGEKTTLLSYQFMCYARDMEGYDYIDAVKVLANIVETYIANNYKMQRLGNPVVQPYITDSTVMTSTLRFSCVYDYETNLIYKN